MSPTSKNLAVGLTVLGALVLLAAMIVIFAGMPEVFQGGYSIYIKMPDARGLKPGDMVTLSGLRVGKVLSADFADQGQSVIVKVHIGRGVDIPSNVRATVTTGFGGIGGTNINLEPQGPVKPGEAPYLAPGAVIKGTPAFDLMSEAQPMLASLKKLGDNLNLLETVQEATTAPATGPVPTQGGLAGAVIKLNASLDAILAIMGDKENQQNIKQTLADLSEFMADAKVAMSSMQVLVLDAQQTARQATGTLKTIDGATSKASQNLDLLTQEFLKAAESAAKTLGTLNGMLTKAQSNQGTLGKLLNDPDLYNRLVDVADEMSGLMKQGNELLRQWKDKGMQVHLR